MRKTTKRTDAIAAARERLFKYMRIGFSACDDAEDRGYIDAFEAAIRAECGTREAALLLAIERAIGLLGIWDRYEVGTALDVLQRAKRRARLGVK